MTTISLIAFALAAGFSASPADEVQKLQSELVYDVIQRPDLTDFQRHWRKGGNTAWFNARKRQVIVVNSTDGSAVRVAGFPQALGGIVATGWKSGEVDRFFVHQSRSPHTGTMIYIDLAIKKVTAVEHWKGH